VEAAAPDLAAVVKAWCKLKSDKPAPASRKKSAAPAKKKAMMKRA